MSAMPFLDEFDLSTVDILLISQYVEPPLRASHPLVKYGRALCLLASQLKTASKLSKTEWHEHEKPHVCSNTNTTRCQTKPCSFS